MKKALSLLLAVAMLLALASLGVSAAWSEDELEARALLSQTMEDLRGDYTLFMGYYVTAIGEGDPYHTSGWLAHSGGKWAVSAATGASNWLGRWLLGERCYEIFTATGDAIMIYPESKRYVEVPRSFLPFRSDVVSASVLLTPREIPDDNAILVSRTYLDGVWNTYARWRTGPTYNSGSWLGFSFSDDVLERIGWYRFDDSITSYIDISELSKQADRNVFATQGMRKIPGWLFSILFYFL